MKVIIAGSRDITDAGLVLKAVIDSEFEITEVVSGAARGVDSIGEKIANIQGWKVTRFPANWKRYGKSAGPIRNKQMAEYSDMAIVVWDGKSSGSKNMIETMKKLDKPVYELNINKGDWYVANIP
jgi:predicted Rossmann fold nucleotide-binding protein DprA/Smf involved in DNA uptake